MVAVDVLVLVVGMVSALVVVVTPAVVVDVDEGSCTFPSGVILLVPHCMIHCYLRAANSTPTYCICGLCYLYSSDG